MKAHIAILNDFKNTGIVKDYVEHHLEDIEKEDLDKFLIGSDHAIPVEEQLLHTLHLERVGFYPQNNDSFAVFDYTISRDITQYVIVVTFDKSGLVVGLDMES